MIKGLVFTPPIVGRISIGSVVEKNGQRLPQKDDQFTLTTQVQQRDGWILHPMDKKLREQQPGQKLQRIPVRLLFNEPDLNLRAEYTFFDRKSGRPVCMGNGDTCRRATQEGVQQLPCPSPTLCEFGKGGLCKAYGRLNLVVGDDEDFGSFIFRTTGFNSIRSLMARMLYYQGVSGGLLAYLPLQLKIRGKSTQQSFRAPIFYVDLELQDGLNLSEALRIARERKAQLDEVGYDQSGLDQAARVGFANGLFEYTEDEIPEIIEEFYPPANDGTTDQPPHQSNQALRQKLAANC